MSKLLVFSFSGFSDQNANGKTLKALLNQWKPEELAQFYCGAEPQDFAFCHRYFHVTDGAMLKALLGKRGSRVRNFNGETAEKTTAPAASAKAGLPSFLRKHNYNFFLRSLRETLWNISPWGRKEFKQWAQEFSPDAILYMVGESRFMDQLVINTAHLLGVPVILYNPEAYRIIDVSKRKGLDKRFYKTAQRCYRRLHAMADLVIYNCEYLQSAYEKMYGKDKHAIVAYNAAAFDTAPYAGGDAPLSLVYFGNLGVGRVPSLVELSETLGSIDPSLVLDVYGKATEGNEQLLQSAAHIRFHGLVDPSALVAIKQRADILVHAESFDDDIVPKLKYAFSTKLAQYLAAGRCTISYAPAETASTQYLLAEDCALVATDPAELVDRLRSAIQNSSLRKTYAQKALQTARQNHDLAVTGQRVFNEVEGVLHEG